jgi:hypothetical protein
MDIKKNKLLGPQLGVCIAVAKCHHVSVDDMMMAACFGDPSSEAAEEAATALIASHPDLANLAWPPRSARPDLALARAKTQAARAARLELLATKRAADKKRKRETVRLRRADELAVGKQTAQS